MSNAELIYTGPIRDGKFGNLSKEDFQVYKNLETGIVYLDPFPEIDYSSSYYRILANESAEIDRYFELHDEQQLPILSKFYKLIRRNSKVVDVGCGGGSMLDYLKGVTDRTIAIEPYSGYHHSLIERGHKVYGAIEDALLKEGGKCDIVLSNHVIEHVNDPISFLGKIVSLMSDDGYCIITTPNYNDILLKLDFEKFAPFFFRTVHNYYFSADSLKYIGEQLGLDVSAFFYYQDYGIDNAFYWLRDGRPNGNKRMDGITDFINSTWKLLLEESGQANNIGVIFRKKSANLH